MNIICHVNLKLAIQIHFQDKNLLHMPLKFPQKGKKLGRRSNSKLSDFQPIFILFQTFTFPMSSDDAFLLKVLLQFVSLEKIIKL